MKILITGGNSQLAKDIHRIIKSGKSSLGFIDDRISRAEVISLSREQLDICELKQVEETLKEICPDVVLNCAAYTNVDRCETDFQEAFRVNAIGPRNLAIGTESIGAKLLHFSTDYVFNGEDHIPYSEYDKTNPKSIYGKTKVLGEDYVRDFSTKYFIVRTSWLYSREGNNFVNTIINLAQKNSDIKVVDDQRGNPTSCEDLAYHVLKLILTQEYGIYHCSGKGVCSWYEFATEIIKLKKLNCKVNPCTTEEFPRPAKRPAYSHLNNLMLEETIGNSMRPWKEALRESILGMSK
ncbi:MAG: dTDP-4-dehydrorhamnose reductase [Clostridium sp.]|uniref:dTDP-4-dehydrorhamnose reductase n=1 Tax=Clostridium sp. TaxID=1506 RepID=UPI003071F7DC